MVSHSIPITVEEAIRRVLENTKPLKVESIPLTMDLLGRVLAEDLVASEPYPQFRASIMDGYAVKAPLSAGVYTIGSSVHAGAVPDKESTAMLKNQEIVTYITTGAAVPEGANAVVKVEDTELIATEGCDAKKVRINVTVDKIGLNIRQIGSDVEMGETVLPKHTRLGPTELGLLATTGFSTVNVYSKPVIGVMSSGDELVDASEAVEKGSSKIRDCNRLALLSACKEDGYDAIDLGIVNDNKERLRERLIEATDRCDIVISSGGVSMGAADFIKPLLAEIGTIHFSKLKMKPGKPTTFASFASNKEEDSNMNGMNGATTLFFGLPGNPVSCLVTKALFVDVALKRLQGLDSEACLHPQISVRLVGSDITLDAERPEYHRVTVVSAPDGVHGMTELVASSTGNQRSSRLLSMKSANALLFLPRGPGIIRAGSLVNALLIRQIPAAPHTVSVHPSASQLDFVRDADTSKAIIQDSVQSNSCCPVGDGLANPSRQVRVGLLTISDRATQGVYSDASGPEMSKLLTEMNDKLEIGNSGMKPYPLKFTITNTAIVPDDIERIGTVVQQWCDPSDNSNNEAGQVDLVLTSGGTGFGLRDLTPEALKPLLHREAPGVAQALLSEGLKHTPLAVLSRPVVGTRYRTLICTLPGSVKAIRENIVCLKPLLPRIFELLMDGSCSH